MVSRKYAPIIPLALVACGRVGFDAPMPGSDATSADASGDDASAGDASIDARSDAAAVDASTACAPIPLGSAVGPSVASGSTTALANVHGCSGRGEGGEVAYSWTAPVAGTFQFDLCAAATNFDTAMYVRDGSCTGTELACIDDGCGDDRSLVTLALANGQSIVIFVDSDNAGAGGNFQLAITQL